jgi:hypothetical protein
MVVLYGRNLICLKRAFKVKKILKNEINSKSPRVPALEMKEQLN